MSKKRIRNPKGFTLVELMIAGVVSTIVLLGIAVVLMDSQRAWNALYSRIYSDIVTDGHVARRVFDAVVRKASSENILLDEDGLWVEVRYYQDSDSEELDQYARFYQSGDQLKVQYGRLNPGEELSTQTVCSNVSSCVFATTGTSVQMILRLDNGSEAATILSSAVAHNH